MLSKVKRYTANELKELDYISVTGEKDYFRYFKKIGETKVYTFRIIPSIGLHSHLHTKEKLALK